MILFPPFSCTLANALLTTIAKTPSVRIARVYLSTRDTDVVGALVEVRAALRAKPIARREKQLRADANSRRRGEDLRKTDESI